MTIIPKSTGRYHCTQPWQPKATRRLQLHIACKCACADWGHTTKLPARIQKHLMDPPAPHDHTIPPPLPPPKVALTDTYAQQDTCIHAPIGRDPTTGPSARRQGWASSPPAVMLKSLPTCHKPCFAPPCTTDPTAPQQTCLCPWLTCMGQVNEIQDCNCACYELAFLTAGTG